MKYTGVEGEVIYLDLSMGAAGDMLTASLLGLLPDRDAFVDELNSLGIPGVRYILEEVSKCGIVGLHMRVEVGGHSEDQDFHDGPLHESESHSEGLHHAHSGLEDIEAVIEGLSTSDNIKQQAKAVYLAIAEAEAFVHGQPVKHVHFHEVGAMDAVADVIAVCMLIDRLAPLRIVASPVSVGYGFIECAHGTLSVPAPAASKLLEGIPIQSGNIEGELCTPTGAALVAHFVQTFEPMPTMELHASGFGMGTRDFGFCNCLRSYLGRPYAFSEDISHNPFQLSVSKEYRQLVTNENTDKADRTDLIVELVCNIDDMTAEDIGYAIGAIIDAGALDAFAVPTIMKKSRPATLLTAICSPEKVQYIARVIFTNTTTLGIRIRECERYVLDRSVGAYQTSFGDVHVKEASGYGVCRLKPEFDDISRIAKETGASIQEVRRKILEEVQEIGRS